MQKKKVLLILNTINDYRVETYNIINEQFDLTVAFNVADLTKKPCSFKKYKFKTRKLGPFNIFGRDFWKQCNNYDAVITSFDIHNFEFLLVPFVKRKFKLLTWSIGIRCSYTRPYDVNRSHQLLDNVAYRILKASDANIFYMNKAKEFWSNTNLDFNKVFVAPNTTSISDITDSPVKNSVLFIGTLYKSKGVDKLIKAFASSIKDQRQDLTLDIIGKGDERENLEKLAKDLGIQSRVFFHGPIYDENIIAEFFSKAILCVSPTQAGLTVPKSMGYGVPMVTKFNAITGGEIYHITPGVNGIIYKNDEDLPDILMQAFKNPDNLSEMSQKAREYYLNQAQPKHQAQGVINALNFAFNG